MPRGGGLHEAQTLEHGRAVAHVLESPQSARVAGRAHEESAVEPPGSGRAASGYQMYYTSGTTGNPKGVIIHTRGLLHNRRLTTLAIVDGVIGTLQLNGKPIACLQLHSHLRQQLQQRRRRRQRRLRS